MTPLESGSAPRALDGLRVLEIASPLTAYCGKMFSDLGADVVLIEPPGGCRLRRERPFIEDRPGIEASLAFAYHNTSKRGITLNLSAEEGRALFRRLAGTTDLILKAEKPGVMDERGLRYAALARANGLNG
jgi:benzylsuccinate CoA-transferase BbsE subunit